MYPNRLPRHRLRFADAPPATGEQNPTGTGTVATERVHTQADVERIAAREKDQGGRAALKKFAEDNGFPTVEAAKEFIEAARTREAESLSAVEKREREAEAKVAAAVAREAAAAERERLLVRKDTLRDLGATGDDLTDALALLSTTLAVDATDAQVLEAATALKTRRGNLFTGTVAPPKAPASGPAGAPPAHTQKQAPVAGSRGSLEAQRRGFIKPAPAST